MCVAYVALAAHPGYRLIIETNRDEYFNRPAGAAAWQEDGSYLAGTDTPSGGTWAGIAADARFGIITNFRDPATHQPELTSRGGIVSSYLKGKLSPQAFVKQLRAVGHLYNQFNLLVGTPNEIVYYTNRTGQSEALAPGIHGLSNGLLNEAWPKVVLGKIRLTNLLKQMKEVVPDALLEQLSDRARVADDLTLPKTGVPLDIERSLSSIFVNIPDLNYGTRASTVILVKDSGEVTFVELTYEQGKPGLKREFSFKLSPGVATVP